MSIADGVVSDVMQSEVVTLAKGDRLDLAEDIMRLGRVRHLPVLEEGRLVGVVSQRDLLAASLSKALAFEPQQRRTHLRSVAVEEVMATEPVTVEASTPLRRAAELMLERKIGCLPVVKPDGTLVGLLSEADLVRAAYLAPEARAVDAEVTESRGEDLRRRLDAELDALRRLRDELRVRAQLAKAEARDLWQELEHKLRQAESQVKQVLRAAEDPAEEVAAATRRLLRELRDGYRRLRDVL
jgi:CBS domain-containing protein